MNSREYAERCSVLRLLRAHLVSAQLGNQAAREEHLAAALRLVDSELATAKARRDRSLALVASTKLVESAPHRDAVVVRLPPVPPRVVAE